jgi:antitoxin VapB
MDVATAKLFQHGGSQAVRLPKEFRMPGRTVKLTRTANGILIQPDEDNRRRAQLFAAMEGSCPDFPDIAPLPPDLPRDPLM